MATDGIHLRIAVTLMRTRSLLLECRRQSLALEEERVRAEHRRDLSPRVHDHHHQREHRAPERDGAGSPVLRGDAEHRCNEHHDP